MKTFTFGNRIVAYSLERANRRTLAITVKPNLEVHVRAPQNAEDAAIERVLHKRALWILRQQRFFAQFLPRTPPRQYVSGETHLYLGRQYRLRIRAAEQEEVKLIGGYIYIYVKEPSDRDQIRKLLEEWYTAHAQKQFRERLTRCVQLTAVWNTPTPRLIIRRMTKRWGSCSSSGLLTLNLDLIRAPTSCIDYVILHELCHIHHPSHSREFYRLLYSVIPDWQERKLRLERLLS